MKITFSSQCDNKLKIQEQKPSFGAGLTQKMMEEIQKTDVLEISKRLAEKGIPNDFKGNKIIAWCCDKTVDILEQINQKYKLKLALPKGIYVDDFSNIKGEDIYLPAFSNPLPGRFQKGSDKVTEQMSLFFNSFETAQKTVPQEDAWLLDWSNINRVADVQYRKKQTSSDFFLYPFLHEFSHVIHQGNFMKKLDERTLFEKINQTVYPGLLEVYSDKYGYKVSQICDYAATGPMEAVACDMPRIIVDSLDKETLSPIKNPFIGTSYEDLTLWKKLNRQQSIDADRPLKEILRDFWNGNFD